MRVVTFIGITLALAFAFQQQARADIIVNFTDGNDITNGGVSAPTPDSFRGTAGNGWGGAWMIGNTRGSMAASVISTTPLNGGGNYLLATVTSTGMGDPFTDGQAAVYRNYTSAAGVQTNARHMIQFDWRIDESLSHFTNNFTNILDDYVVGGASNDSQLGFGTGGIFETWRIDLFGATGFGVTAHHFGFENGDRAGGTTDVDSGLTAVPGTTYHFIIDVDPTTRSWAGSISDGTNTVTSGTLGFRSNEFNSSSAFFNGRADGSGETRTFALDSIRISSPNPVPEPSTLLLVGVGLIGLSGYVRLVNRKPKNQADKS